MPRAWPGTLIRPSHVTLERVASKDQSTEGFRAIGEVIGRETTRAITRGEVLRPDWLRSPLLVRRGDMVTVCARAGGVCVRTTGRARDDGSLGDLVAVEAPDSRDVYYACVVRPREVEVYARARQAAPSTAAGEERTIRR